MLLSEQERWQLARRLKAAADRGDDVDEILEDCPPLTQVACRLAFILGEAQGLSGALIYARAAEPIEFELACLVRRVREGAEVPDHADTAPTSRRVGWSAAPPPPADSSSNNVHPPESSRSAAEPDAPRSESEPPDSSS